MPHARREGRRPECRRGAAAAAVLGLALALLAPAARAQVTTSGTEDGAVLVEAAAAADTSACSDGFGDGGPCPTVSWRPGTMVCGDGWDSYHEGWVRVECDTSHGRVVRVYLSSTGIGGALLQYFGRLGALVYLALDDNRRLRGNLAELAGATNLRMLHMADCPNVVGDVAALSVLVHLGGQITMPCDAPSDATCPWDAAFTYNDCCASSAFALSGGASCGNDGAPHPRIPFLFLRERIYFPGAHLLLRAQARDPPSETRRARPLWTAARLTSTAAPRASSAGASARSTKTATRSPQRPATSSRTEPQPL